MRSVLSYKLYNKIKGSSSQWMNINEGITFSCEHIGGKNEVDINYNQDTDNDVVKLANRKLTRRSDIASVPTYAGYALENVSIEGEPHQHTMKRCFSEHFKKMESVSYGELKELIAYSYPEELKKVRIPILLVMGSSSPLAVEIANALKELYYPYAKVIDIMKAYYGVDPNDMVDWDKFDRADATTQKNIKTWLKKFSSTWKEDGVRIPPEIEHTGFIKKSSGLQSGGRRILKPGHNIDDYIIGNIADEMRKWSEDAKGLPRNAAMRSIPYFLTVDDLIIEGSTMQGAFKTILDTLKNNKNDIPMANLAIRNLLGYVLFSYGKRFS